MNKLRETAGLPM